MDYTAAALGNVFERRNSIKTGLRILSEAPIMRHFTVELDRIESVKEASAILV
jgi:tryptophanase